MAAATCLISTKMKIDPKSSSRFDLGDGHNDELTTH